MEASICDDVEESTRRSRSGKESRHIAQMLKGFDYTTCEAWSGLTQHFSSGIRHRELISIAFLITEWFHVPKIPRDARRSYPMLVKWFQDHWTTIQPMLPLISIRDDENCLIDSSRESVQPS
jgi:hypothetical protein